MACDLVALVFDVELCARNLLRAPGNAGAHAQLRGALDRLKAATDTSEPRRHETRESVPEPPAYLAEAPPLLSEDRGRSAHAPASPRLPYKD